MACSRRYYTIIYDHFYFFIIEKKKKKTFSFTILLEPLSWLVHNKTFLVTCALSPKKPQGPYLFIRGIGYSWKVTDKISLLHILLR